MTLPFVVLKTPLVAKDSQQPGRKDRSHSGPSLTWKRQGDVWLETRIMETRKLSTFPSMGQRWPGAWLGFEATLSWPRHFFPGLDIPDANGELSLTLKVHLAHLSLPVTTRHPTLRTFPSQASNTLSRSCFLRAGI